MINRRKFLKSGAALGVAGSVSLAAQANNHVKLPVPEGNTLAQRVSADINNHFLKSPVMAYSFEKNGQSRIYITLTTKAHDADGLAQKIGGSWYFDIQQQDWRQKKDWISKGTRKQYEPLVAKVKDRILTSL